MTGAELWLQYHQTSRASCPPTSQLVELELQNHKLHDLEDVLDHIFQQGFVEARHRPHCWWEKVDGEKVKGSICVEELLQHGVGKSQESALRLVISDIPPAVWFGYHYHSAQPGSAIVKQRVKLEALHAAGHHHPKVAHVTNHIFANGFIAPKFRSRVHWETECGKKIEEHAELFEILAHGEGISEDKPLRLVIDDHFDDHCKPHHPHHPHTPCSCPHHH